MKSYKPVMKWAMLLPLLQLPLAFADGSSGSHGGNAVVCFNDPKISEKLYREDALVSKRIPDQYIGAITKVELLDLYEARQGLYGEAAMKPLPLDPNETEEMYVDRILGRFKYFPKEIMLYVGGNTYTSIGSRLAGSVLDGKKMFEERIRFANGERVIPQNDIHPITEPGGNCVITTMAAQQEIGNSSMRRMVIDERLFNHPFHSKLSKAMLYLHEYFLADAVTHYLHHDSDGTRAIVARMVARDISLLELNKTMRAYGTEFYNLNQPLPALIKIENFIRINLQTDLERIESEAMKVREAELEARFKNLPNRIKKFYRLIREKQDFPSAWESLNRCFFFEQYSGRVHNVSKSTCESIKPLLAEVEVAGANQRKIGIANYTQPYFEVLKQKLLELDHYRIPETEKARVRDLLLSVNPEKWSVSAQYKKFEELLIDPNLVQFFDR